MVARSLGEIVGGGQTGLLLATRMPGCQQRGLWTGVAKMLRKRLEVSEAL